MRFDPVDYEFEIDENAAFQLSQIMSDQAKVIQWAADQIGGGFRAHNVTLSIPNDIYGVPSIFGNGKLPSLLPSRPVKWTVSVSGSWESENGMTEPNLQSTIAMGMRDNIIERLGKMASLAGPGTCGGFCINCERDNFLYGDECYVNSWICATCGAVLNVPIPKAWVTQYLDHMVGSDAIKFNVDDLDLLLLCWINVARLDEMMVGSWYRVNDDDGSDLGMRDVSFLIHSVYLLNTYDLLESLGIE